MVKYVTKLKSEIIMILYKLVTSYSLFTSARFNTVDFRLSRIISLWYNEPS